MLVSPQQSQMAPEWAQNLCQETQETQKLENTNLEKALSQLLPSS